jgi:hypothetical protein
MSNVSPANQHTSDEREQKCLICGYSKHLERAHILPKSFVRLIEEFQNYSRFDNENIMLLCKNHHWEYDHDILDDDDFIKILKTVAKRNNFFAKYSSFICGKVVGKHTNLGKINNWILKQRSRIDKLGYLKNND